jgi:hypothetical protein
VLKGNVVVRAAGRPQNVTANTLWGSTATADA